MPGLKSLPPRAARRPQGTDATPLDRLTAAAAVDAPPRPSDPRTRSRGRDNTLVLVDRVRVGARFEKLDNALARTSNTCPVKYRLRSRKKANNFACQAMIGEQYPQIGHVSSLYGLFQFNQQLMS